MHADEPLCYMLRVYRDMQTCRYKHKQSCSRVCAVHAFTPRFAIRHTITLALSLAHSSIAVVMAAVGKAERDFSGVIPKAERCEM